MCLEVKEKCEPVLRKFNFAWPDMLNCANLPESGKGSLCMDPPRKPGEEEEEELNLDDVETKFPGGGGGGPGGGGGGGSGGSGGGVKKGEMTHLIDRLREEKDSRQVESGREKQKAEKNGKCADRCGHCSISLNQGIESLNMYDGEVLNWLNTVERRVSF